MGRSNELNRAVDLANAMRIFSLEGQAFYSDNYNEDDNTDTPDNSDKIRGFVSSSPLLMSSIYFLQQVNKK